MFITLAKVMIPVMLAVKVADDIGAVSIAGKLMAPLMGLFNLPPEAAIIWVTTILTGIYGGIASIAGLAHNIDLTAGQLSALAAMMLISHNIPVEQSIVRKAGASFAGTATLRIIVAAVYGAIISWTSRATGIMSEEANLMWLRGTDTVNSNSDNYFDWLVSTSYALGITFLIIVALVLILDALEHLGITERFTKAITPLLRISGLNEHAAPVTTVGVLLGLSYGGALIIEESERRQFSARTRLLSLSWLSLCHSLIEDTLLLAAIGANLWVILVGRVAVTLIVIAILAKVTHTYYSNMVQRT